MQGAVVALKIITTTISLVKDKHILNNMTLIIALKGCLKNSFRKENRPLMNYYLSEVVWAIVEMFVQS